MMKCHSRMFCSLVKMCQLATQLRSGFRQEARRREYILRASEDEGRWGFDDALVLFL